METLAHDHLKMAENTQNLGNGLTEYIILHFIYVSVCVRDYCY